MKQKEELLGKIKGYIDCMPTIQSVADEIQPIRKELDDLLTDEENYTLTSKIKSKIQQEADEALDNNGGSGLIIGATGIGKSKIAIDKIKTIFKNRVVSTISILLVVPTEKLRDEGWRDEFKKWGIQDEWEYIMPICYASLHTIVRSDWDLIILDECHNITEANAEFFFSQGNSWENIVALTATEPRNIIKLNLLKQIGLKVVYEIGIDVSVRLGLVAPYEVVAIGVELDRKTKNIKAGDKEKSFFQTEYDNYMYLTKKFIQTPNKFSILNRMRFIYNLPSKTEAAKNILKYVIPKDSRVLTFCGSIKQAEELSTNTYHSKTDSTFFDLFNEEKVHRLFCVDGLNEGHNINSIDCGFMLKITRADLRFIQRTGRLIRYRPGHKGKVLILYAKDTVDELWVKEATKGVDPKNITWIDYNRLRKGEQTINF